MTNGWTDERALRPLSAPVCPWADACCTGGARSCSVVAQAPGRVDCPLAAFLLRHVTHAYLWPAGILPPLRTCGVFGRHWAFWSLSLLLSMLGLAAQLGFCCSVGIRAWVLHVTFTRVCVAENALLSQSRRHDESRSVLARINEHPQTERLLWRCTRWIRARKQDMDLFFFFCRERL